jgi:uncharacterized membrane protein
LGEELQVNAQRPSRELSVEETLRLAFNIYSGSLAKLFVPFLIGSLIPAGFLALRGSFVTDIPSYLESPTTEFWGRYWSSVMTTVVFMATAALVTWIVNGITEGVCVKYSSDIMEKGDANLGESIRVAFARLAAILVATLISSILIGLGTLALIVPGIIIALMYSLVLPVVVAEKVGALDSLSRSKKLVDGRWLKTFVFFLIVFASILFVTFIASLMFAPLGQFSWLATSVVSASIGPIGPISVTVHYYSMVAREKEQLPPPPPF